MSRILQKILDVFFVSVVVIYLTVIVAILVASFILGPIGWLL